jgi:hypothetical protein
VTGYTDGTFAPNKNITRQEMAVFLYRYADLKGYDISQRADLSAFTDSDKVQSWAQDAMSWAVATGLVNGVGDDILDPNGLATRAQVATILMRFCDLIIE